MTAGFTLDIPYRLSSDYAIYIEGEPDRIDLVIEHLRENLMRDRRAIATPIASWLGAAPPRIEIAARERVPPLQPREMLIATGLDAAREAILDRATHVATISASFEPQSPRIGLWGSYALACAVGDAYDGAIEDRAAFRILSRERREDALRGADADSVAPFITVVQGRADDGGVSATTLGLARYGLPEVALAVVPDRASGSAQIAWLLQAAAQYLVDEIASSPGRRDVPPRARFDSERFARAAARIDALPALGIEVELSRSADARSILIGPPPGDIDERVWLARGLGPLGYPSVSASSAKPFDGDPEMEDAMAHARATLDDAKSAYLDRNETTFVKRRFIARAGRDEYIWIAVDRWNGTTIVGRLANTPLGDVGYALDRRIEFDQSEAVDWIVSSRDGTRAGNFTGDVIARREGSRARGA